MFILDYREKQNEQRTEPINIYLTMLTGFFSWIFPCVKLVFIEYCILKVCFLILIISKRLLLPSSTIFTTSYSQCELKQITNSLLPFV